MRVKAIKVLVLFTDGRPTAFHDVFDVVKPPSKYDGVLTVDSAGTAIQGMYDPTNGNMVTGFDSNGKPVETGSSFVRGGRSSGGSSMPLDLPGGLTANGTNALALATSAVEDQANTIRAAGYRIYCIGLGNLDAAEPTDQPDLDLLRRVANVGGMTNPNQPRGDMLFAPSSADLKTVFGQVADRILTRLTR